MFKKKRDPRNTELSATPISSKYSVPPKSPLSLKSFGAKSIAETFEDEVMRDDEPTPVATFGGGFEKLKEQLEKEKLKKEPMDENLESHLKSIKVFTIDGLKSTFLQYKREVIL